MSKFVPTALQPVEMQLLRYDDSESGLARLQKKHESDREFQAWEDLPDGVKDFTIPAFCQKIRCQRLAGKMDPDVKKALQEIYATAAPSRYSRTVLRGLSRLAKTAELAIANVGDFVPHPSPTSTTTSLAIGIKYSRDELLVEITLPRGSPIIVYHSKKMEILLPYEFWLRIDQINLNVPARGSKKGRHTIKKLIQATAFFN